MKPSTIPGEPFWKVNGDLLSHEKVREILEANSPPPNQSIISITVPGPASIAELARALKNDPDLIFQYVYNNVDLTPIFGAQKGAFGTLVDGLGGPFDQCMLLVALLRQAGFTADYVFGQIQLTPAQLQNWLGVSTADSNPSSNLLSYAGIPYTVNSSGGFWTSTTLSHIWVQVNIGGTNYLFDPSFKSYDYKAQIDLPTALGYNQATFLSQSKSGATITSDSVTNLNRANIRSQLATFASNLSSYIQTNMPTASIDDVLGGHSIVQNLTPIRQTSLPYEAPGDVPTIWTDIPNGYRCTLRVQFGSIDQTFFSDAIHHQRLTITFNGLNQPVLMLNGSTISTGAAMVPGNFYIATYTSVMSALNGFTSSGASGLKVTSGATYLVGFAWGPSSRAAAEYHKRLLDQNRAAGTGDGSEPVLGEALAVQWFTYHAIESRDEQFLGLTRLSVPIQYVHGGTIGWDATVPFFDLQIFSLALCRLDVGSLDVNAGAGIGITAGGTEGKTIRHQYALGDLNTNRVMDESTLSSTTIYDATSANWLTNVKPNLTGYPSGDLSYIETNWINQGWRVVLPQNGNLAIDSINSWGAFAAPSSSAGFGSFIGRPLGGMPTQPCGTGQTNDGNKNTGPAQPGPGCPDEPGAESDEPIGMYQGNYLYKRTDIAMGSANFPYGIAFARNYDSSQRYIDGPLGLGWSHNFNITAKPNSDAFQTLGDAAALFAVPSIVALFVIADLSTAPSTQPAADLLITALVERWMTELATNNTVLVSFQQNTEIFAKLADGSFASVEGSGASLTLNAGAYTYTSKTGQALVFNTSGQIASWTWPNGMQLSFTYQSGKLQSVTNGLTRTLTFTYAGNYISQISDGNGRIVAYNVDGNKNLTSCTDTLSHTTAYAYDAPGRLSQIFLPQNPAAAIITNVYDTLDRVQTQNDALNNQWTYFFAGSRAEEDDPVGGKRVFYFDRFGNVLRAIDQLGNESDATYDVFQRVTSITLPEGNRVQFVYDGKSNLLSRTDIAKSGSGLANIVNSYTYDSTWNKVKTAVDGRGNTTTYNYDPSTGNLLNIQRPQVGGQTPQITFTFNSRGQVLTRTDETAIVSKYTYDTTTEKLLSAVHDFGASPHLNLTASFAYNSVGDVTSVTDPNANTTNFQFDTERRLTLRTEAAPFSFVTQFGYDFNGQKTSVQRLTAGVPPTQTYSFAYTLMGKLQSITDPLSYVTNFTFDTLNRLWKVTDAENRVTAYAYDARSMVSSVTDNSNTAIDRRQYTNNGRLSQRKDANNNATNYGFDGFDRLSQITYADSSFEQFTYDANGNRLSKRTRSGNSITFTYDVLNRLSTKSPQGQATAAYTYDLAGRRTQVSTPAVAGNFASGLFQFNFDSAGRYIQQIYPDGKTLTEQLDANGNVTRLTWPDSTFHTRAYDQLNRLTDVFWNGGATPVLHFVYDALSRRTLMTRGDGSSVTYGYQLNDDLTSLIDTTVGGGYTLTYNKTHQMISKSLTANVNLLWHPTSAGTVTYGAANSINQYPTYNGQAQVYDSNGNLRTAGANTLTYDTENHLISASNGNFFQYDPLHRLIGLGSGTVANIERLFIRGQEVGTITGGTQTRVIQGNPGEWLVAPSPTFVGYFTLDPQQSVGSPTTQFGPFGELRFTGIGTPVVGYRQNRWSNALGVLHVGRRQYSPALGRFMQPDPMGFDDHLNQYTYCDSDPLNLVDPQGLYVYQPSSMLRAGGTLTKDTLGFMPALPSGPAAYSSQIVYDFVAGAGDGTKLPGCGLPGFLVPPERIPLPAPGPNTTKPRDRGVSLSTGTGVIDKPGTGTDTGGGGAGNGAGGGGNIGGGDSGNGNGNGSGGTGGTGNEGGKPPQGINIPGVTWPGPGYFGGGDSPEGPPPGESAGTGQPPSAGPSIPPNSGPYIPKPTEPPEGGIGGRGPNFG